MADEITTKKVENLSENTEPADTDVYLFGASGTNVIKKIKWSNILSKLKSILFANNLTTTQEGYGLDARQGKALKDEIDKINTKIPGILKVKKSEGSVSARANTDENIPIDWDLPEDTELVAFWIERVAGSGNTTNIIYCNFSTSTNVRIKSTSQQDVTVAAACLYH